MKNFYIFILSILGGMASLYGQNGTQADSARVIIGSQVQLSIDVLSNDNLVAGKNYSLESVFKSVTSQAINISIVNGKAVYQDIQGTSLANDTFFYVAKNLNDNTLDTNYVVVRKTDLPLDVSPGDANKDNICNHLDVLNIGIGFGKTNQEREGIYKTNTWGVLRAYNWNTSIGATNAKHADADGDGKIDSLGDIATVYKNYNRTVNAPNSIYSPTGGKNFVISSPDTLKLVGSSQTFGVNIQLGTAADKVEANHGIAFSIVYDKKVFKKDKITFVPNNWYGNASIIPFWFHDTANGKFDIALTKRNQVNSESWGDIGRVDIVIDDILDGLTDGIQTNFKIEKALLVNESLTPLPVTIPSPKVITIKKAGSAVQNVNKKELQIQINPSNLNIQSSQNIKKLNIFSILGQTMYSREAIRASQQIEIAIENWPSGVYFIQADQNTYKVLIP